MVTKERSPFRVTWQILGGLAVLGGSGALLLRHRIHTWLKGDGARPLPVLDQQDRLGIQPCIEEPGLSGKASPNFNHLLETFKIKLTAPQKAFLETHKFVLVPRDGTTLTDTGNRDEFLDAFDKIGGDSSILYRSPENAKLITPDLMLHAFNRFFVMTQEELEKGRLRQDLKQFLEGILEGAAEAERQAPTAAVPGYDRIRAQFAVALAVLDSCGPLPPPFFDNPEAEQTYFALDGTTDTFDRARERLLQLAPGLSVDYTDRASRELELIYTGASTEPSPLFGRYDPSLKADYTQFTPRSYYARSSALRAYFRTMMYLGRTGYAFKEDSGLSDALLLAGLFSRKDAAGKRPAEAWQRLMDTTSLYAGTSDDLTYPEWRAFLKEVTGSEAPAAEKAGNPVTLATFRQNAAKLRRPRILSDLARDRTTAQTDPDARIFASQAFRVFGQRFTYDAWILNRLNAKANLPATALYLPACFGDRQAIQHAQTFVRTHPGPVAVSGEALAATLEGLAQELSKEPASQWEASMSSGWLSVLSTLTRPYGPGYPLYMQSKPFGDKQIQTFLGSYAELKHATLLYAKQSYAEMGEGGDGPIPPVVKGFVEPNLDFWRAFSGLVKRIQRRFEQDALFPQGVVLERLKEFSRDTDFYRSLAIKELKGEPISDDDYETLRTKGLSYMAEPLSGADEVTEETGKVALVADVLTDGGAGKVLYEATGRPYLMLALVGNEKSPRLTLGLAFNHYEFSKELGRRVTDEDWKPKAYANPPALPPKNVWYRSLETK